MRQQTHSMNRNAASIGLLMAMLVMTTPAASAAQHMVGAFKPGALAHWKHKSFKGKTRYRLVGHGNTRALEATCNSTASAIAYHTSKINLSRTPVLRWQWRVAHVYPGLNGATKAGDDYAARIYVIHDGGLFAWKTRAINYVWANSRPVGSHWPNPFTDKDMMVALTSGPPTNSSRWVSESRNVRKDFKRFYGLNLDHVDAVAVMTDCDNSARKGRAWYRHIRFTSK